MERNTLFLLQFTDLNSVISFNSEIALELMFEQQVNF
jgi:hypothetical protein